MSQTEQQFVANYAQLVGLSADAEPQRFHSVGDYHKLEGLGPSLATLKVDFPTNTSESDSKASSVTLNFKSIKPPFKFSHTLEAASNLSIYKVKTDLIAAVEALKKAGVQPGDIKLLVKGKVYADTVLLSTLEAPEVSFMCMVSPPAAKNEDPDDVPMENVEFASLKTIKESTWNHIQQLVAADLDESSAKTLIAKWKDTLI